MGIEMRPRNIKLGEVAEKQLCELQDMFSPFCANRSATVRTAVGLLHVILTTPGILEKLNVLLQGTSCVLFMRTQNRVLSPEKQKPGPMRAETEANSRRAGAANSTYRLTANVGSVVPFHPANRKDRNAWNTSFAGAKEMLA